MYTGEEFYLQWDNFQKRMSKTFRDLRTESDFYDVVLVFNDSDGRTLETHKVILGSCSKVLKQMLRNSTRVSQQQANSSVIYLRGVKYNDLSSLLDFIYQGEVRIPAENFNSFMLLAEDLHIEGLIRNESIGEDLNNAIKLNSFNELMSLDNSDINKRKAFSSSVKNETLPFLAPTNVGGRLSENESNKLYQLGPSRNSTLRFRRHQKREEKDIDLDVLMKESLAESYMKEYMPVDGNEASAKKRVETIPEIGAGNGSSFCGELLNENGLVLSEALPKAEDYYVRVSKDSRIHKCKMCSKINNNSGHMKEHVLDVHFAHIKTQCNQCHKWFRSGERIRRHLSKCK